MIKFFDLFTYVTPAKEDLSAEDVRDILETRFREEGRTDRKVGAIRAHGDDFLRANIVSLEGDIIKTVEVNKRTGAWSAPGGS
jgi:hypothetical protein